MSEKSRKSHAELAAKIQEHKHTHDFRAEGVVDVRAGIYRPMPGNCKKCGLHYQMFKVIPTRCPKYEEQ